MEIWEREAARAVNKARSLVRREQNRLYREEPPSQGRDWREGELEEVGDLLHQAKAHIDPHCEIAWEFQTPLPF